MANTKNSLSRLPQRCSLCVALVLGMLLAGCDVDAHPIKDGATRLADFIMGFFVPPQQQEEEAGRGAAPAKPHTPVPKPAVSSASSAASSSSSSLSAAPTWFDVPDTAVPAATSHAESSSSSSSLTEKTRVRILIEELRKEREEILRTSQGLSSSSVAPRAKRPVSSVSSLSQQSSATSPSVSSFSSSVSSAQNEAPYVGTDAANLGVIEGESVQLNGFVIDDDIPHAATVTWSTLSGPANAVFENPNAEVTTAVFPAAGVYMIRISANDGEFTSASEVMVVVFPAE